jgi:hypothetical protein
VPPVVAAVAPQLLAAVASITVEEFRAQDLTFDSDSRRGRELLRLMADGEWLVETAEVVDVRLAHAVETTLRLTVDLGRVRHEAVGDGGGGVPLPLLTLPLVRGPGPVARPPGSREASPGGAPAQAALSLTVTDQAGATVAAMAPGEVRRIVSAALADILLRVAALRWPGPGPRPAGRRAERLVLSAALHRMLRDRWRGPEPVAGREAPPGGAPAAGGVDGEPHHGPGGLRVAQTEVRRVLAGFVEAYRAGTDVGVGGGEGNTTTSTSGVRPLVERAARVLDALADSLCLVLVVPLDPGRPAGLRTFTVRLPARRLVRHGDTMLRGPRARLEVDLLFPSADADRRLTLTLPDGVAWETSPGTGTAAAHVHVDVDRPRSMGHLDELMGRLLDPDGDRDRDRHGDGDGGPAPPEVARCLADLAVSQVDAVQQTLAHHRVPDGDLPDRLRALRAALVSGDGVAAAWRAVALPAALRRDTTLSAVSPGVVEARIERIDDRTHHGRPHGARAVVDVTVTDSELLGSARFTGAMNLVLMVAVLLFLLHPDARGNVEVVAAALTLFAAIQAGRVVHPDGSTFRGMLAATGYWLVVPSMLPPVILAVALAFVYQGDAPATRSTAAACAAVAIAGQVAFQAILHRGPPAVRRAPARPPRLVLATAPLVDHERAGVLHSAWWRAAVAEALAPEPQSA